MIRRSDRSIDIQTSGRNNGESCGGGGGSGGAAPAREVHLGSQNGGGGRGGGGSCSCHRWQRWQSAQLDYPATSSCDRCHAQLQQFLCHRVTCAAST